MALTQCHIPYQLKEPSKNSLNTKGAGASLRAWTSRRCIEEKFRALSSRLHEATLRLWAAVEARTLGHGGVSAVAKASGLARTTIYAGLRELGAADWR